MVPPTLGNINAFHHVGDELYLQRQCCSSKVCDGAGEDDSCNSGWWFAWVLPSACSYGDHGIGNYIKSLGGKNIKTMLSKLCAFRRGDKSSWTSDLKKKQKAEREQNS